jgi:hypothetical protein
VQGKAMILLELQFAFDALQLGVLQFDRSEHFLISSSPSSQPLWLALWDLVSDFLFAYCLPSGFCQLVTAIPFKIPPKLCSLVNTMLDENFVNSCFVLIFETTFGPMPTQIQNVILLRVMSKW